MSNLSPLVAIPVCLPTMENILFLQKMKSQQSPKRRRVGRQTGIATSEGRLLMLKNRTYLYCSTRGVKYLGGRG